LTPEYTILIADRNSHVRKLLKRELESEGLRVLQAEKGKDVIEMVYQKNLLDLVLLDSDLPDIQESVLLKKLENRVPPIPVVLHTLDSGKTNYFLYVKQAVVVEKGSHSIEKLKQIILDILEAKIMEKILVKDVMVALENYATVSENATLYDAVLALEKAQEQYKQSQYVHRAILVFDNENKIVGKISQLDILMALEPNYRIADFEKLSRFGYSLEYLQSFAKTGLWDRPLRDICRKATSLTVKEFMHTPEQGEYIKEDANLDEAIHQLLIGKRNSLLVTRNLDIIGILRLTDVFAFVCDNIKACKI